MSLLPTPRASDTGTPGRRASEGFRPPLSQVLLGQLLPTPRTNDGNGIGAHGTGGPDLRTAVALLPTPRARDHKGRDPNPRGVDLNEAVALLPTPNAALGRGTGTPSVGTAADRYAQGKRFLDDAIALLPTPRATDGAKGGPNQRGSSGDLMLPSAVQPERWGAYAAAVTRWERITGRAAPNPTETGTKGQQRLAPAFVEWLMGLPAGWVTDHLPRNPALKCLGNGVVPQQAAHAYADLLVGVS